MMTTLARTLAGPFLAACGLLVVSGLGKVAKPARARVTVTAAGLPFGTAGVIAVGLAETTAGLVGGVRGGRAALAVAACYLLLMVFAVRLRRRAPNVPCGCLGNSTTAVTGAHVAFDAAATAIALIVAFGASPWAQLAGRRVEVAIFVVLTACCARLAALALEDLPDLAIATREPAA